MNVERIVQAAIPGADAGLVERIIFGRTLFPFARVTPQRLYKAASAWRRAEANGLYLCDHCHNLAGPDKFTCRLCSAALRRDLA